MTKLRALFAALLLFAGVTTFAGTAPTALALPTECQRSGQWYTGGTYAGWICFAGSGHYILSAKCAWNGLSKTLVYTYPQVGIGEWAWVRCPAGLSFTSDGLPAVHYNP